MEQPTRRKTSRGGALATLIGVLLLCALPASASGTAGALDATFGSGGVASTPAESGPALALAQQSGRKIVYGSVDHTVDGSGATTGSFWRIRRLTASGALDTSFGTSFGTNGEVELFGTDGTYALNDMVVDASDRILCTGSARIAITTTSGRGKKQQTTTTVVRRFVVVRLLVDGALDTSFGDVGVAAIEIPAANGGSAIGSALHVLADGRILAAGHATDVAAASGGGGKKKKGGGGSNSKSDALVVMRLLSSGDLDTTFGDGGITVDDATAIDDAVWPGMLEVQSTGRIILGGVTREINAPTTGWMLTAYGSDGSVDTDFGRVVLDGAALRGMTLDAHDRILASGQVPDGQGDFEFTLIRYAADGSIDTSFGSDGVASLGVLDSSMGDAVRVQADEKIVATVMLFDSNDSLYCRLVRFTSSGALDASFGINGFGETLMESGLNIGLSHGGVIDAQGDIVMAGVQWDSTGAIDWIVARWCGG